MNSLQETGRRFVGKNFNLIEIILVDLRKAFPSLDWRYFQSLISRLLRNNTFGEEEEHEGGEGV